VRALQRARLNRRERAPGNKSWRSTEPKKSCTCLPRRQRLFGRRRRIHTQPTVPTLFELAGQLKTTRFHDPSLGQYMDVIGNDVIQQTLVVGDDNKGAIG